MLTLGIDSSTQAGTVSLLNETRLLGEKLLNLDQTHSQRLMPQIIDLITSCGYQGSDLEAIGVTQGPGSFTGTRIGIATAKTLAQSLELPIVGVSTLRSLAYSLRYVDGYICSLIDARGGRVFAGLYRSDDRLTVEIEEDIWTVEELLDRLAGRKKDIYFVGQVVAEYQSEITNRLAAAKSVTDLFNLPRAGAVAKLANQKLESGEQAELLSLTPCYLKQSQAEIEREQKQKG